MSPAEAEHRQRRIIDHLDQMVSAVREGGRQPILFNVPYPNESMFTARLARELHEKRDYHNGRLRAHCDEHRIPLADICSRLRDQHFGDAVHPNGAGARMIAEEVFGVLGALVEATSIESRK